MRKNLKNRVISIFLLLCLAFSSVAYATDIADTEQIDSGDAKAVKVIKSIGVMRGYEDGSFHPNEGVTRAEFATCLQTILNGGETVTADSTGFNQSEWDREFYGTEYEEESTVESTNLPLFRDVTTSHWAYSYIKNAVEKDLMIGTGVGYFEPEREITATEAVKVMVGLLGYSANAERYGGYPNGYINVAAQLGLLSGIDFSSDDGMKRSQLAKLIYNALDVNIQEIIMTDDENVSYAESDEDFLSKFFSMRKIKGDLTDNGITTLYGPSEISEREILVDGIMITVPDSLLDVRDAIGATVEVYYSYDKSYDEENVLVYYELTSANEVTFINADDIDSFTGSSISYSVGTRSKTYTIKNSSHFIFNGSAVASLTDDMTDISSGWVRIVDNGTPTVVIKKYRTVYIGSFDESNLTIYDKLNPSSSVCLSDNKNDRSKYYKFADGTDADVLDLSNVNVAMIATGDKIEELILGGDTVSGNITSVVDDDDYGVVIEGTTYYFADEYLNSEKANSLKAGDDVILTLNAYGRVAWAETSSSQTGINYGYIYKCYREEEGDNDTWHAKVFTTNGTHETYAFCDSLIYVDEEDNSTRVKTTSYESYLDDFKGFISYTLDENKNIKKIEMPLSDDSVSGRLHKIYEITPSSMAMMAYKSGYKTFGWKISISDSTIAVQVPSNINDKTRTYTYSESQAATSFGTDEFSVQSMSFFQNDTNYTVTGYSTQKDSKTAEYLVYYGNSNTTLDNNGRIGVITNIEKGINKDNEACTKITVSAKGSSVVLTDSDEISFDSVPGEKGSEKYKLTKGDFVRYTTDGKSTVKDIYLVFDADGENPSGGAPGYLASVTEKFYVESNYIDLENNKNNMYNRSSTSGSFTDINNPYCLNGTYVPAFYSRAERKVMLGYVLSTDGTEATVTTQDMSVYPTYFENGIPTDAQVENGKVGVFITDHIPLKGVQIEYVEYERRTDGTIRSVNASVGSISDFKTYEDAGANCSKVVVLGNYGDVLQIFIINEV